MNFNDVKRIFEACPEISALDAHAQGLLLSSATEIDLPKGTVLYREGDPVDGTFCLLLFGKLEVEQAGMIIGEVSEQEILGEVAFFSMTGTRSATVRSSSSVTALLKFDISRLSGGNSSMFTPLHENLGAKAWRRFVCGSQS